jgi:PAS domain S-box-containing protein
MAQKTDKSPISSTEFQGILNNLGSCLFICDAASGEILFINDSLKALYNLDGRVLGRRCWEVLQKDMIGRCPFCPVPVLEKTGEKNHVWEEHNSLTGRDFKNTSSFILLENNRIAHLQHGVDITELKNAEKAVKKRLLQQELMSAVSQSFVSSSSEDMSTMINNALFMIGNDMNVSRAILARLDSETNTLIFEYEWYNTKQGLKELLPRSCSFKSGDMIYDTFVTRGDVDLVINNVDENPEYSRRLKPLGMSALIYAPVFVYGAFWGILSIGECFTGRTWDRTDIQLIKMVANSLAGLIIRKEAEEEVRRMSSIVNSSPQYISYITPQGDYKYLNPAAQAITGYSVGELMEQGMDAVLNEENRKKLLEEYIPEILEKGIFQGEILFIKKSGEQRLMEISGFPVGVHRKDIGIIAQDITEKRQLEQDLIAAKEQAEQSSRAKGTFLARMSHEMRTPLNAIIGMTTIARSSEEMGKMEYCLSKIDEASVHLLGVINEILDMSKIEAGKFELSSASFNMEQMIRRTANVMAFKIDEKKQKFVIDLDSNLPEYIVSDEQRLAQVLTNLLANAVKFTPPEGTITLSAKKVAEEGNSCTIRVEVADTGIGIVPEQRKKLFTLFEQGDGSIARKYGGTGLGLAIVKSIVELLGGEIGVESEPGKGSVFFFTIAMEKAEPVPAETPPSAWEEKAGEDEEEEAPRYSGRCILLAEDVEINREIVISLLEDTGVIIDCAENGFQAVEMYKASPSKYNMVFMDIHMPEMDGYEATRCIRAFEEEQRKTTALKAVKEAVSHEFPQETHGGQGSPVFPKGIPIIAMTANVFREDVEKCAAAGMNDHIGKPIDLGELFKKMDAFLLNRQH